MSKRIVFIQRGDFGSALAAFRNGGVETYQGQFSTIRSLESFSKDAPRLVLSIGSKPEHAVDGNMRIQTYIRSPIKWIPGRIKEGLLASRIVGQMARFKPSHVILRLSGQTGVQVLKWTTKHQIPTAIVIASTLDPQKKWDVEFCQLANDKSVAFAANHLRVATQSLIDCGLNPAKAVEYDFPDRLSPDQFPAKSLGTTPTLLYVGTLSEDKGVRDLLDAMAILHARGKPFALKVCGDGAMSAECQAAHDKGLIQFLGRVERRQVVELMREASALIMPSRPSFAEGMPLVLLEALATRTPIIASNHPVFTKCFGADDGIVFFSAADAQSMAQKIEATLTSPQRYALLSAQSADAWRKASSPTEFDGLFRMLEQSWGMDAT